MVNCTCIWSETQFYNFSYMYYKSLTVKILKDIEWNIILIFSFVLFQLYSILGYMFPEDSSPAFALFKFVQVCKSVTILLSDNFYVSRYIYWGECLCI